MISIGILKNYFKQFGIIVLLTELFAIISALNGDDFTVFAAILAGVFAMILLDKDEQNELIRSLPVTRSKIALTTLAFVQIVFVVTSVTRFVIDYVIDYNAGFFRDDFVFISIGKFIDGEFQVMLAMFIIAISGSIASAALNAIIIFSVGVRLLENVMCCFFNVFFGYKYDGPSVVFDNIETLLTSGYQKLTEDFSSKSAFIDVYMVTVLGMLLINIILVFLFITVYKKTEKYTKGTYSIRLGRKGLYAKNILILTSIMAYVSTVIVFTKYMVEEDTGLILVPYYGTYWRSDTAFGHVEYMELSKTMSPVIGILVIMAGVAAGLLYTKIKLRKTEVR